MLLRRAHGMSDKQFIYADLVVFSTSKVWYVTRFKKHNYAQDGAKLLNYQNQLSNVGTDTVIMAKLRWVRLLHKCPFQQTLLSVL